MSSGSCVTAAGSVKCASAPGWHAFLHKTRGLHFGFLRFPWFYGLQRQQWCPAQLAPGAVWHLETEAGNGVSGWSWGVCQHLPHGVPIGVSPESGRMRQKPQAKQKSLGQDLQRCHLKVLLKS